MIPGLADLALRAADAERAGAILVRLGAAAVVGGRSLPAGAIVAVPPGEFARLVVEARAVPAGPQTTPAGGRIGPAARAPAAVVNLDAVRRRVLASAPPRRPWPRRGA